MVVFGNLLRAKTSDSSAVLGAMQYTLMQHSWVQHYPLGSPAVQLLAPPAKAESGME